MGHMLSLTLEKLNNEIESLTVLLRHEGRSRHVTMVPVSHWVPNAYAVQSQFDPHENSLNSARFGFCELRDTVLLMRQEVGLQ